MNEIYHIYTDNPTIILSIIIVILFYLFKPKKINSWYGYRTSKSTQNQEQWNLAQKYSSTLSVKLLFISLLIQLIIYKIVKNYAISSLLTMILFVLTFAIIIYKTEKKLKIASNKPNNTKI